MNAHQIARIINDNMTSMRRFARSLEHSAFDADDLVQACAEKAVRKRRQLRDPERAQAWLMSIMYREFLTSRRKAARREQPVEEIQADCLRSGPASQETRLECAAALDALGDLPPDQRAALTLTAVEGLSGEEAAAILGQKPATVRSHVSRARIALRDALDEAPAEVPARPARTVNAS